MGRLTTLKPRVGTVGARITPHEVERVRGRPWMRFRSRWLSAHPLCVLCQRADPPRVSAATELDHVTPLWKGGDMWQVQGLCASCHADKTARETAERY